MTLYMVRIMRDYDDDYADVAVEAGSIKDAERVALDEVLACPQRYFDTPPPPRYFVDPSSDVEDLTGTEYDTSGARKRQEIETGLREEDLP